MSHNNNICNMITTSDDANVCNVVAISEKEAILVGNGQNEHNKMAENEILVLVDEKIEGNEIICSKYDENCEGGFKEICVISAPMSISDDQSTGTNKISMHEVVATTIKLSEKKNDERATAIVKKTNDDRLDKKHHQSGVERSSSSKKHSKHSNMDSSGNLTEK
jgi:hypothetical protein